MRQRILVAVILAAIYASPIVPSGASAASFTPLGTTPNGHSTSAVQAISGDGTTVVGYSSAGFQEVEAFRWTATGGFEMLCCADEIFADDVSADGTIVVGVFFFTDHFHEEAFLWTSSGGMVGLGDLPGFAGYGSSARGVSADGTVIVGRAKNNYGDVAFRWTSSGGMQKVADLPDGTQSSAFGISADGLVIVGRRGSDFSPTREAFRWTADGGMVFLGDLPGGAFRSLALAASADGSVIVGAGTNASGNTEAFRWTSAEGMVALGTLNGETGSQANAVSGDGSVVVGAAFGGAGQAFVWTPAAAMQPLADILIGAGATGLDGWTLTSAIDISTDGRTVTGKGQNPQGTSEGFVATLPTGDWDSDTLPDSEDNCIVAANLDQYDADADGYGNWCDADLNNSGRVTTADYTILRNALNSADPVADLNHSGSVTTADYTILRNSLNKPPGPSALGCAGTIPCP